LRPIVIITLAGMIGTCSSPPPLLDQVLEKGELRVVTRDSPTAYTKGPAGLSGPEFDRASGSVVHGNIKLTPLGA